MRIRMVRMRDKGVELDRSAMRDAIGYRGELVIMDVTDQGLRRPTKVGRLMQGDTIRSELIDVRKVWCNDGRLTLAGFERHKNSETKVVEFARSWLCTIDLERQLVAPSATL